MLWLLVLLFYMEGAKLYLALEPLYGIPVFFTDTWPDGQEVTRILETEKEKELPADLCFYHDGGLVTLHEEGYGRQAQAAAAGIQGAAFLYDRRANGFAENDRNGCMIDEQTARELFGTTEAVGRNVAWGEESFQIREILPLKERIFLYHPKEKDAEYTRIFVGQKEGESVRNTVSQVLMSYGLDGMIVEGESLKLISLLGMLLVPLALFVFLFSYLGKGSRVLLAVLLAVLIWRTVRIPLDWLPGRWSDFSFYPQRIGEETEKLRLYLFLPKTAVQTENFIRICKSVLCSAAAFVLCLGALFPKKGEETKARTQKDLWMRQI